MNGHPLDPADEPLTRVRIGTTTGPEPDRDQYDHDLKTQLG